MQITLSNLNANGVGNFGASTLTIQLVFEFNGIVSSDWFRLTYKTPSQTTWTGVPGGTFLSMNTQQVDAAVASMNAMGLKAWMQANVCNQVTDILKAWLTPFIGAPVVVPPPSGVITHDNIVDQVNASLSTDFRFVLDAAGFPIMLGNS